MSWKQDSMKIYMHGKELITISFPQWRIALTWTRSARHYRRRVTIVIDKYNVPITIFRAIKLEYFYIFCLIEIKKIPANTVFTGILCFYYYRLKIKKAIFCIKYRFWQRGRDSNLVGQSRFQSVFYSSKNKNATNMDFYIESKNHYPKLSIQNYTITS
ncbi:hypothetical protein D9M68_613960 [compost metagenome]